LGCHRRFSVLAMRAWSCAARGSKTPAVISQLVCVTVLHGKLAETQPSFPFTAPIVSRYCFIESVQVYQS
ncbi:MAG: hypothetical protein ACRD2L_12585, partial [Terriglobia bacterium]